MSPQNDFQEWIDTKAEELTPSEMRLAAHLRENMEQWSFEPASQLGVRLEVHRSTIVRFAQRLGMAGFPELQTAVRQTLLKSISPASELALTMFDDERPDLARLIYERELTNLRETYRHLDPDALTRTAEGLAGARRVVTFGRRFSYPIAHYLSLALKTMRSGVRLAPDPGGSSIDLLYDLGPEDFALAVSLRRYSPEVQKTLKFLSHAKTPYCLLTDVSPIAHQGEKIQVIQAHIGGASVLESYTALVSVCHTLLAMVYHAIPDSQKRLRQAERAWRDYNKVK